MGKHLIKINESEEQFNETSHRNIPKTLTEFHNYVVCLTLKKINLLKLKASFKDKLADGKSIGGSGRLTEEKIKQLQKYYGLVIRQNNY